MSVITISRQLGSLGIEIAQAVAWLCSDEAFFVVGGIFPVDGGYVAQ